ncbi:MAG: DUF1294 domain-containing protein [Oscillospiraceae bacterium]|nr:DUF1294 domain-containing protein [Oscillospiraceae bacterium]
MTVFFEEPVYLLLLWLAVMSTALFFLMGADKRRARRGSRRVPEARLFLLAFLGGAIGGTLGMYAFRHKTRHWYFALGFPAAALLQIAACVFLKVKL